MLANNMPSTRKIPKSKAYANKYKPIAFPMLVL